MKDYASQKWYTTAAEQVTRHLCLREVPMLTQFRFKPLWVHHACVPLFLLAVFLPVACYGSKPAAYVKKL